MNYAGSQKIIVENGDHAVFFRTMVSVVPFRNLGTVTSNSTVTWFPFDTLSVWGLAYAYINNGTFHGVNGHLGFRRVTVLASIRRLHRHPSGRAAGRKSFPLGVGASARESCVSGATNITHQFGLGLPNGLNVGEEDLRQRHYWRVRNCLPVT